MKKTFALLFTFVALIAFLGAGIANAQSPKTDNKTTKVEQAIEKKDAKPCCDTKGQATSASKSDCCAPKTSVQGASAKAGCAPAGKTCGGCSSKAKVQTTEELPVPKK